MIKAKPTKYCGVQFRSRTEAKYCMLFNMFDVPWTYEPRRFPLPSGSYLPDFFLKDLELWIEVKGIYPTEHERTLCEELQKVTKQSVAICYGWPPSILIWTPEGWVRGQPIGIHNTKLTFGGKPLPTEVYQEINEKIYGQTKRKSVRPPGTKKREVRKMPRSRRRKS